MNNSRFESRAKPCPESRFFILIGWNMMNWWSDQHDETFKYQIPAERSVQGHSSDCAIVQRPLRRSLALHIRTSNSYKSTLEFCQSHNTRIYYSIIFPRSVRSVSIWRLFLGLVLYGGIAAINFIRGIGNAPPEQYRQRWFPRYSSNRSGILNEF